MIKVLFAAPEAEWPRFQPALERAFERAGLDVDLALNHPPEEVDYIVYAPSSTVKDFAPFTKARAVLNLWAGVEGIVGNPTLKLPLARMVEDGLTEGMVEWVTGQVLRHHLGLDRYITGKPGVWEPVFPPLARDRSVAVLGLGELGAACAAALAAMNFRIHGWSRTQKSIPKVQCQAGENGLATALAQAQILVLLLPSTPQTENVLNAERLALLPEGAVIINPGRGPLIDDDALLAALDRGQVSHATLDVFRTEPLPGDHPFWHHPNVTVTPHVASATRAATSALTIAENIRRGEAGAPLLHLVDTSRGY